MSRPRSFDYGEARRLRDEGLSYPAIAEALGLRSHASVFYALNSTYRERKQRFARARSRRVRNDPSYSPSPCGWCLRPVVWKLQGEQHYKGVCIGAHSLEEARAMQARRLA